MTLALRPLMVCVLALLCLVCDARSSHAQSPPADALAQFDRGAELLSKDPFAAKTPLAKAAGAFEAQLNRQLSAGDRARLLYNLGVARQLGGELGPAVLAFRRAELLKPTVPGLAEHLAAARAATRGEPAPDFRNREIDAAALMRDWTLSVPQAWVWRTALGAYVLFWGLMLVRSLTHAAPWRPSFSLMIAVAFVGLLPVTVLAAHHERDRRAASEAVVLAEAVTRLQPDDLIGQPSPAGTLKPGTEVEIIEERIGGNGQPWVRVGVLAAPRFPEMAPAWVPESSLERIVRARRGGLTSAESPPAAPAQTSARARPTR